MLDTLQYYTYSHILTPSLQEDSDDHNPQEQHEDDQHHLHQVQGGGVLDRGVSIQNY